MALQYFYGNQSEQFSFYRIPKVLFTDERYRRISIEAKILYSLMLDRMSLSRENNWTDDENRVYIIYSVEDIMAALGCGNKKVSLVLNELEAGCGLIERKRRGFGLTNLIYVKNFVDQDNTPEPGPKTPRTPDGDEDRRRVRPEISSRVYRAGSKSVEMTRLECQKDTPDVSKRHANDTEESDTYLSNNKNININPTALIASLPETDRDAREVKRNEEKPSAAVVDEETRDVQEIFELILDTVSTGRASIRVCGEVKPAETVRSRFRMLTGEHVQYVIDRLRENTTDIRNPKQYILAALYNAPLTMGNHYAAMVSRDERQWADAAWAAKNGKSQREVNAGAYEHVKQTYQRICMTA